MLHPPARKFKGLPSRNGGRLRTKSALLPGAGVSFHIVR